MSNEQIRNFSELFSPRIFGGCYATRDQRQAWKNMNDARVATMPEPLILNSGGTGITSHYIRGSTAVSGIRSLSWAPKFWTIPRLQICIYGEFLKYSNIKFRPGNQYDENKAHIFIACIRLKSERYASVVQYIFIPKMYLTIKYAILLFASYLKNCTWKKKVFINLFNET